MKSQQVAPAYDTAHHGRMSPTGKAKGLTSPLQKPNVSHDDYVALINCLVASILGDEWDKLGKLSDLPEFIDLYETAAIEMRSVDTDLYFRLHQVASFAKKLELPLFDKKGDELALSKWLAAEATCKEKNCELWDIYTHPFTTPHVELQQCISKVSREIASLLGDVPPDLPDVAAFMKFGKGASLTHSLDEGAGVFKLLNSSAYCGMKDELEWLTKNTLFRDLWLEKDFAKSLVCTHYDICDGDALPISMHKEAIYQTVPKSVSEKRTIEIGPSIATFVQQGYDGFIRRLLHDEWGLDLQNQAPNQELARQGSIAGEKPNSPCTIDLSSASDRISFGVVAMLLPSAWVRTLMRYRAKVVRLPDGTLHTMEKFSSMGNALTFSLQTLIFAAVVRSILRERGSEGSRWRVYGDDIIVPYRIYDDVVYRLELLGFQVNKTKSFSRGFFRESCGGDFLHGTNVRPFYLKKPLTSVQAIVNVLNDLQLFAMSAPIPASDWGPVYSMVLSFIPRKYRVYGETDTAPDSCIWAPRVVKGGLQYRLLQSDMRIPDKLGMLSRLLTGYEPSPYKESLRRWTKGFLPTGVELKGNVYLGKEVALELGGPIVKHGPPVAPGRSSGTVIRKAPKRGYTRAVCPCKELPFDPFLLSRE
jgi:hypothetical protein